MEFVTDDQPSNQLCNLDISSAIHRRIRHRIERKPDRVLLECERLYDADRPGMSGFMLHVLDEENTVVTFVQGNTLDNKSCDERLRIMSKILKKGERIYIAGRGELRKPRTKQSRPYFFPKKGTFYGNGRGMGFAAIANEHGACFDAYTMEQKPCPSYPFPVKK